jgi:hypothetical protein
MHNNDVQKKNKQFLFYRNVTACLLLALSLFLIYSNTFNAAWHFDDKQNILTNSKLHLNDLSLESLTRTFFANPRSQNDTRDKLYRPLPMLTFGLNWYFGKNNVIGYHVVNLSIHILTAFFLYFTLLNILKTPVLRKKYQDENTVHFIALLAALLWSIHPVQIQAVTYIVQRMAAMAAMFYIISIYLYIKARLTKNRLTSIICFSSVFITFCMALGSKQNSALLPFSLILIELVFFQSFDMKKILKPKYIIPGVIAALIGIAALAAFFGVDPQRVLKGYEIRNFTLTERLLTEPRVILFYLSQLFYPVASRFSIDHSFSISHSLFDPVPTFFAILSIIVIISSALIFLRRYPVLCFAVLFFFLNHSIESTIIPLELVFEHRNYIPSFFIFLPVAMGCKFLLDHYRNRKRMIAILSIFFTLIIVFTGFGTYTRNLVWRSNYAMWKDAMEKSPLHARPHQNLSICFSKINDEKKVIELNTKALHLKDPKPDYAKFISYSNIGLSHAKLNQERQAIHFFKKALEIEPKDKKINENLATQFLKIGELDQAEKFITTLVDSSEPGNKKYFWLQSLLLLHRGEFEKGAQYGVKALKYDPDETKALLATGSCFASMGNYDKANHFFQMAYTRFPGSIVTNLVVLENYATQEESSKSNQIVKNMLQRFTMDAVFKKLEEMENNLIYPQISKKIVSEILMNGLKAHKTEVMGLQ